MEKIVTKIGDVTIQRRAKPQQQPPTPGPQVPPQQQYQHFQQPQVSSHPRFPIDSGNIPQQQHVTPIKSFSAKQEQIRLNAPTIKNVPRPASKNVNFGGIPPQGGGSEFIPGIHHKKLGHPPGGPSQPPRQAFPQQRISDTLKNQENLQKLDVRFQLDDKVSKTSVNKNVKTDLVNKDSGHINKVAKPPVRSAPVPLKLEQTQRKDLKSEPDISKYSGISIERRKKVEPQPQEFSRNPLMIPGVNVQRIPSVKENPNLNLSSELDEEYSEYEEDFEEAPSDEEFDDLNFINPNYGFGQYPVPAEKKLQNKPSVQYPLENTRHLPLPKPQPQTQPCVKSVPPSQPQPQPQPHSQPQLHKNLPILEKFKQSGLTIEKRKPPEVKKPIENFNIPGIDIQRLGKVQNLQNVKQAPLKSPLKVSNEDDEKQFEGYESDLKEGEDYDEYYENESEEFEDEAGKGEVGKILNVPNMPSMPNIPNLHGVSFEKRKRPDLNLEELAKQSGFSIERRKDSLESLAKKPKPAIQNKSPIILSSEDDERNEEEFPEKNDLHLPQQLQKKLEPNIPPGISIQKRKPIDSSEKKASTEVNFQRTSEELKFMNEDDGQMDDYQLEDEDDYEDDLDTNVQDEFKPSQYDPNYQKQVAAPKLIDKAKIPGISNADLERFVQRSGITIEKKSQLNISKESEDFDNYDENQDQLNDEEGYDDMENEGEYDEMEDEAFNEEENPEAFESNEDLQIPEKDMSDLPEMEDESEENVEEKDITDEGKDEEKEADINDIACKDLVELIQKGEIEGEIEDDKDDEEVKKDDIKRKAEETEGESNTEEEEEGRKSNRKKKKKSGTDQEEEEDEDEDDEEEEENEDAKEADKNIDKSKITSTALRKNIREVMDETKLDESTLAAQRQEAERLKRLQEQQRIIREVQKQIQMSKQNEKSQNKVLSLLQGNSQTSILKTSSIAPSSSSTQVKVPNHVLVKLSNGQQTSLNNKKMMELLKTSKPTKAPPGAPPPSAKTLLKQGMVTPSVSIAPLVKKEQQQLQQQPVQPPQQQPIVDEKKKKGDVVTLSSDSEDDCIVLSEEDESEPEEDPTNSGMHTSDKYNVPDEQGRVVVNVGHPETEEDLYLAPQIARIIKPHQIGGIRFLYDNVIESVERFTTSSGFGCILAHSMGLGKTLQIVSFSDIFLRYTSAKTILVIMPINTIQNWLAEFNMWLPKENKTDADVRCREFDLFIVNESLKNINSRSKVILEWHKSGGVLLMGYELFRLLSLKKSHKSKKKKKSGMDKEEQDSKNKELIEEVYAALVRPGPDLVICDEGHRIKNSHATTSQALKQIRTKRRIVLTGYPLQNNLLEYWCMVDFVRPNYLGSKTEFSNMFERPIQNGQCIDSTPQDKKLMRYRAHVLHSLLEGFVQRRSHAVLQNALPEKEEYVLLLRFTAFQRKLYDTFMNEVVRTVAVPNPLKAFAVCCKIWNHPDVLYNFLKKKGEEIDLDLEEALPPSMQPPGFPYGQHHQHQQENPATMFNQGQSAPQPWPKRGPGSRGGKIRQIGRPRVGRGGRKPAATIPPNVNTNLPTPEKPTSENANFSSGQFQSTGTNANQNPTENVLDVNRNTGGENFPGRNYNQNQFGASGFNEFPNQSNYQSNTNFTSKNPLDNLEDISSGNFQNKRFFDTSNNSGNQTNFPNPSHNFESSQSEQNFSQTVNSPNDSNMNASFESNLNSSDSTYNQNDSTKSFDYNPDFNPEFFPGENFQSSQQPANISSENKTGFRDDGNSNSNSYFQGSNFQGANTSNTNFEYQSAGSNIGNNFQSFNRPTGGNFQNSNPGTGSNVSSLNTNFQGNVQNSNFQATTSNTAGSEFIQTDFQGPSSNFPCSNANQNANFQNSGTDANNYQGQGNNFMDRGFNQQQGYWSGSTWVPCNNPTGDNSFVPPPKYGTYEGGEIKSESKMMSGGSAYTKSGDLSANFKTDSNSSYQNFEDKKIIKTKEEEDRKEDFKSGDLMIKKEDSLPYDWATDLFKNYITGIIENSSKMEVFFHIVNESIKLGDRLLVFSQSLLTLDLIEDYLQRQNVPNKDFKWAKHRNYFRLDGSTPGLEREKLINEFNSNNNVYLFLVSTRAGSLGINLVGANRVVVFDASWNPCHDTQAVCRVYRYGQQKPCFVYRLVMDNCLEKKIYDRQINKQGMADRVVDELNPDAHLSIKEVTNLCWDDQEDTTVKDFSNLKDKYNDEIIKLLLARCSKLLSKEPFQHESLLIDRKEKKLSTAEKRLAKRSYELEKQAANQPKNIYSFFPNSAGTRNFGKPIASVRPMQSEMGTNRGTPALPSGRSRWIPAEVWQKQGMSAQEMTLPLDVVIPTNSPDKTSIVLKAGQRVMVLKSPKGIYMQLENGKIIAIRTAFKVGQNGPPPPPPPPPAQPKLEEVKKDIPIPIASTLKNNPNVTISPKTSNPSTIRLGNSQTKQPFLKPFSKGPEKKIPVNLATARSRQVTGKTKQFALNRKFQSVTPEVKQRLMSGKMGFEIPIGEEKLSSGEQSGTEDCMLPDDKNDDGSYIDDGMNESSDEKTDDKLDASDSLETLRKVTERISVDPKRNDGDIDPKNVQMSSLKKYRHNFTSHVKNKSLSSDDKNLKDVSESETESEDVKGEEESSSTQQGNENVQNWLMNQTYPPMDPYGNYFPGYFPGYGPGPAPMMPPYDGFYPGNYGHPIGRNSPMVHPPVKQEAPDNSKTAPQQPQQPIPNPNVQNVQNVAAPRNSPVLGTPPMYPPYPNPYPYPYNYPANPGFNNQGYPYPPQTTAAASTTSTTTNTSSTNPQMPPTQQQPAQQQMQQPSYDNSMYSAFHRPDGHFQGPENPPYPPPYPRPPYPNSGTPGFFPYNAPYPNYPYGNFNPYMHPPGYGYPMQNPPPVNNPNNSNVNNNNQPSAGVDGSSSSTSNNNNNSTNNS